MGVFKFTTLNKPSAAPAYLAGVAQGSSVVGFIGVTRCTSKSVSDTQSPQS